MDANPGRVTRSRDLSRHIGIDNREYQAFKRILKQLAEEGKITRHKGNRYGKLKRSSVVTGTLRVKTQGYGFVLREDGGEDVFISEKNMGSAMHRDKVRVELFAQPTGKLPEGEVVEVLERGHKRIVGTFHEAKAYHFVVPDELKLTKDVYIQEKNRSEAQDGQKVVAEIIQFWESRRMPEGKVIEVLGYPNEKGVDVLSVAHSYDLPINFPEAVIDESEQLSAMPPPEELQNRLDLRDRLVFTIDPDDAKDFDDAVSLEDMPNGNILLGVHIADVSAYVRAGSAVDLEALKRGTSVYLVDRVIPMLPERLSNALCSLRPDEDKLTYSVLMELSPDGRLVGASFRESIIRSRFRLTYRQAYDLIVSERNRTSEGMQRGDEARLRSVLARMAVLSKKLFSSWRQSGNIDFDMPEAQVVLDDNGRPSDLRVRERLESHRLVEAFMLLANRTVAERIQSLRQETGMKLTFVYRVHDKPKGDKLAEFVRFVRALGYEFDPGKSVTPKKFQRLLEAVKGSPHEVVVETVALRTMMKAIYTTANTGHFGLAFKYYTHFTSPIRRYPDLIVHRLLKAYLKAEPERPETVLSLAKVCETATEREIIAQEAERESIRAKQVEFMEDKIGETFDGVVAGVVAFGIFVEIPQYLVEGLVHVNDLADDYYVFDEKHYRLVGQNAGKVYRLGDRVRVRVARVLKDQRKIDFELAAEEDK
jgi:ribonuclease R